MRLAILVLPLMLLGCAKGSYQPQIPAYQKAMAIELHVTREQVLEYMGRPGDRQFRGSDEVWQYCDAGYPTNRYSAIWFHQGAVTGVETYAFSPLMGNHCTEFREVNWSQKPDITVEVR